MRRRLASLSTLSKWRGLTGAFASPALKSGIRLAVRAVPRTHARKSAKAVTGDVLAKLLATCESDSLRDLRDKAILMVAFASGGRRRSEIARLRVEQLTVEPPIEVNDGPPLTRDPSWSNQNDDRRAGRCRLSHRPTCRSAERLAGGRKDRKGQRVSGNWAMGHRLAACARSAVGQCDLEAAGTDGRVGKWGVFGARVTIGIFDGGHQSRNSPSRGDGAVQTPVDAASIQLLYQCHTEKRKGSPSVVGPDLTVRITRAR